MFYFELDDYPVYNEGSFTCISYIYYRIDIPLQGRRRLYEKFESTSSYFLVIGEPTKCIYFIPTYSVVLPFKRKVRFTIETLDENIRITLLGLTSSPTTISGLPQTAAKLIQKQCLRSKFGTIDCRQQEKALLPTPV